VMSMATISSLVEQFRVYVFAPSTVEMWWHILHVFASTRARSASSWSIVQGFPHIIAKQLLLKRSPKLRAWCPRRICKSFAVASADIPAWGVAAEYCVQEAAAIETSVVGICADNLWVGETLVRFLPPDSQV
jgi:hypothetical protein